MKIRGGYTPRIAGRPASDVHEVALPEKLLLSLERNGTRYTSLVRAGQSVAFGDPVAEASVEGGTVQIPAPARGRVARGQADEGTIVIDDLVPERETSRFGRHEPERISGPEITGVLARAGIWPFFWSARSGGVPSLGAEGKPKAIVINTVLAEPFRARGRVLISRQWDRIIQGIRFLPRLLADYGRVEIVLTAVRDPVARKMYADLSGFAWARLHSVPVLYPVENPRVLAAAVRQTVGALTAEEDVWLIDVQGMAALGACLAEGLPLHERTVVTAGPGVENPRHHVARIGTPTDLLAPEARDPEKVCVLRGGLLTGTPIRRPADAVQYDDDAFFFLPEASARQFLSFVRPGFDRTSYLPSFATAVTRARDKSISTSLRGERRPCISCGLCERVCPAGLLPQILHRYLYRDAVEQAEKAGIERCVDCNLCTFVCPSKIELQRQFADAEQGIRSERGAERAAMAAAGAASSEKESAG